MRAPFLSLFRFWRAALLLLAAVCLSPERAAAGCGAHVTILNDAPTASQYATRGTAQTPTRPPAPCEGPNCSGAPSRHAPPLAPATPPSPQAKEVAQCPGPVSSPDGPRRPFDRDLASPRPIHRSSSVFHPPRV